MTERALPVMTERIASGGAASLTAALPREGVHGRRHTPKHRREGHGQRRQHLETVRGDGSLLPLSLGHARRAVRGGSQALESCRPAALAAARRGASVDFTHEISNEGSAQVRQFLSRNYSTSRHFCRCSVDFCREIPSRRVPLPHGWGVGARRAARTLSFASLLASSPSFPTPTHPPWSTVPWASI